MLPSEASDEINTRLVFGLDDDVSLARWEPMDDAFTQVLARYHLTELREIAAAMVRGERPMDRGIIAELELAEALMTNT